MPEQQLPIQPVGKPILCKPFDEPNDHWIYDKRTGDAKQGGTRRPAGYWYKTTRTGSTERGLFIEEDFDDLPLVNRLREDVRRWREADYRGASNVTKDLLRHWGRRDLQRPLFFCQREAVETIIYLAELRIPGRSSRTGFQRFELTDEDLSKLLNGNRPSFQIATADFYPTLVDPPFDTTLLGLRRIACKMATGSGKTVVMAMLISWAFCNRAQNPLSKEFPSAVVVVCPNLTIKERLQVLRPENPDNYYDAFEIVPSKYKTALHIGKVMVENWHYFGPESEHKEGDKSYAVVNKGPETPETFARRVLGDLYGRMPVMVLNDEGHHCWRPKPEAEEEVTGEEKKELESEKEEATVWIEALDRLNNVGGNGKLGISLCVDLSATPFYIKGSGHPEGRPFPWIVSDFGLVDAIESGIVKIPRLPVLDTTGRPDPKYFRLWEWIKAELEPAEFLPGRAHRPKPDVIYREAEGALQQIAGQWAERFSYIQEATPGQEHVPPVLIVVCDNTDVAEVFHRNISGETEEEIVTEADLEALSEDEDDNGLETGRKKTKNKTRTVYGQGKVYPQFLSNTPTEKRTIRIDTKLLAEAESEDPSKRRQDFAEELRRVVATVGKKDQPGEKVRCVVSVAMLNEGWDATNVTHVLGIRAFGSQLLCEQVVGRGLRRMDYTPDPRTGFLVEEYVDVYGIPFTVIPFKGRPVKTSTPEDKPKNHVRALEERSAMEMRFPVVEAYAFALKKNLIRCDVDSMEGLSLEPSKEPTATFIMTTQGYREGSASHGTTAGQFQKQDRQAFYEQNHLQTIEFEIVRLIVSQLTDLNQGGSDAKRRALRLQSRHQLFPQVYRFVDDYVNRKRKVDFQGCDPRELGLEKYVKRIVEWFLNAIEPDQEEGEPPLLPVLNRHKPIGTTAEVDFKTTRPCVMTNRSHINQVVADTDSWEQQAVFHLEACKEVVEFYARNDHLDLLIPYEYFGVSHSYDPDFVVRLANGLTVILEIKGFEDNQDKAKHIAAGRWVSAVNNWGKLGRWAFHVCREPQLLGKELRHLVRGT